MGRGCAWTDVELGKFARAWLYTSEDAVTGVDKTVARFRETIFEKFKSLARPDANDRTYAARSARSVRAKFDEVAADIQKFRDALRLIRSSNPTGVTEGEIFSMEIYKHLGKRKVMSYDARSFPHSIWRNHLDFKAVRTHPKFSEDGSMYGGELNDIDRVGPPLIGDDCVTPSSPQSDNPEPASAAQVVEPPSQTSSTNGSVGCTASKRPLGRKSELRLRANDKFREKAARSAEQIAESLQRRSELLEEKNALSVYSTEEWETPEDRADRAEFLRLLRKSHMKSLRERLTEGDERGTPTLRHEQAVAAVLRVESEAATKKNSVAVGGESEEDAPPSENPDM